MAFSLSKFTSLPSSPASSRNNHHLAIQQHVSSLSQDYKFMYHEKLEEIRLILNNTVTKDPVECLTLVKKLKHLAIDYHFKDEIHSILNSQYENLSNGGGVTVSSLVVSLGYPVTTDVSQRLMNIIGGLEYQVAQYGIEEDEILDEESTFTKINFVGISPRLAHDQANVEGVHLDHPCHMRVARFCLKQYLENNENGNELDDKLLYQFAKLDFNVVQSLHRREIQQFSLWWRDLGLAQKLNFARDQPVKWYMWSLAAFEDPRLSEERINLTKSIALVYLMDDIFDVYGTYDELVLFTEAITKWEVEDSLPYSMKLFLTSLYDSTDEFSSKILQKHGWNPQSSLKRAWIRLCHAFLKEAKWFASGQLPSSEEYLRNGVISSRVHVVLVHLFFLIDEGISKESVVLLDKVPGLISNTATILRLWDDLGSAKDENQKGYDGSYIDCYLEEHKDATVESAREHIMSMISDTWKKLNKEYLTPNLFPLSFKKASLNFAKLVSPMYSYDADRKLPSLEKQIKSLLYESIPLQ